MPEEKKQESETETKPEPEVKQKVVKSTSDLKKEQAKRDARNKKEADRRAAKKARVECSICEARGPTESSVIHNDGCKNRPGETKYIEF